VGDIQQMFTQGTLQNTGVSTDVALNGDGFFVVKGTVDGLTSNFYTRAGTFKIDQDGALTNPAGLKVQGYKANGDGTFAASITDIMAPTAALPARATEMVEVTANLDAAAKAINTAAIVGPPAVAANPWDPQNPMLKREVCGGDFEGTIVRSQYGVNYGLNYGFPDATRLLIQVEAVKQ
jgi:flagellar hook protein FlgE